MLPEQILAGDVAARERAVLPAAGLPLVTGLGYQREYGDIEAAADAAMMIFTRVYQLPADGSMEITAE